MTVLSSNSFSKIQDNLKEISTSRQEKQSSEKEGEKDLKIVIETRNLGVLYGNKYAIKDVSLMIPRNAITAIIGPSGCGKSTC